MQSYKKQWVIIPYHNETAARWIQEFRIGIVSTAYMRHIGCSKSVHTDLSVANTEQCVDKNKVLELAFK